MPDVLFALVLTAFCVFAAAYLVGQYLRWRAAAADDARREVERAERRIEKLKPLEDWRPRRETR